LKKNKQVQLKKFDPLPNFFDKCIINLYDVGDQFNFYKRHIVGFGGDLSPVINEKITHIITNLNYITEDLKELIKNNAIPVISGRWITECIAQKKLLDITAFNITVEVSI